MSELDHYKKRYSQLKAEILVKDREIERIKDLCHDYYSAGLTAGHPLTTMNTADRELKELNEELNRR